MKLPISILFICISIFCGAMQLPAQTPCEEVPLPKEKVMVQLDRNVCLAGETIWFKAWCFVDGQLEQELSKVLYLEIFDETQKVIVQEKYLLHTNRAEGSIHIPEDVPGKYYFLKAYTRYMRNFSSEDYHYQQITIVNPLIEGGRIGAERALPGKNEVNTATQGSVSPSELKHLQIQLDNKKYQAREQINFHLESVQPITAGLSVTVRWQGLGNHPTENIMQQNEWLMASCREDPFCRQFNYYESPSIDSSNAQIRKESIPQSIHDLQWRPETRGLTISGKIQDTTNKNIEGALTMVSALQEEPMLYVGTTDEQGTFTICLQHMQQQKNLFVGTPDDKNKVLIRNDFDSRMPEINAVPLQFDSTLHSLLTSLYLHQQLDRIYPKNKTDIVYQPRPLPIMTTNIVAPDQRTVLSDYIKVPSMIEVFREITTGVSVRQNEDNTKISVFDPEQQRWHESPLILLDNVPIFDNTQLLTIDPAKVEAIEIHHTDYILGDHALGTIISVITKTDDFAGYQWGEQVAFTSFRAFAIPSQFEQVLHQEESHYPDFRPVVYWQPELQFEQQRISERISIYAPDRPGMYEVLVQGYTDSGEPCLGYVTFEVLGGR